MAGGSIQRLMLDAEESWNRKEFQACFEKLQEANRLAPANTSVLLQLGRTHGLRYDYANAERYFEQAIRIAPRKAETLVAAAVACQNFRKPGLTDQFLRRAIEQPDVSPEAFVLLAELYERLRRLPEAAELIERALKINAALPSALLMRARFERLAGRLEPAETIMRSFLGKPIPNIGVHSQCWYELATILDRQGRYDDAMTAFVNAKNLLRPQQGPLLAHLNALHARYKIIEASVSAELFQRWFADAPALAPARRVALLCGQARSGTTLLEQVLDAHPYIITEEETDIFFDEVFAPLKRAAPPDATMVPILERATIPTLQQLRANYFEIMEKSLGQPVENRLLIDKNPGRTFWASAFIRAFPETKLLVALRDPRDIVLSCFMVAHPHPLNPATASFMTLEGTADHYAESMSMWRTLKPMLTGHYLEVRYEEVVENLEPVARRTLEFLGLPWDNRVLGFDGHARKKMVRSPTYADVTQKVYTRARGRWRNYQKYMEPCLEKLEPFVKAFGYE
jgi:tetratricopeptide (TPR) repeat protein